VVKHNRLGDVGMMDVKAIRVYLTVESDNDVVEHTGRIVKTFVFALNNEIRIYHGMKGIVSPIHISPLFSPGSKENELGDVVTPVIVNNAVVPVKLDGREYVIHIGGERRIVESISKSLEKARDRIGIKVDDNVIFYKVEKVSDVTSDIMSKTVGRKVALYLKGPVIPFNVFAPTRLPKFSISAVELLYVGYMFYSNELTINDRQFLSASRLLGLLVETYYSLRSVKVIMVPFKGRKEPCLMGEVIYIVDTDNPNIRKEISTVLSISEIVGIGESRNNGFGTITFIKKE